MRPNGHSVDVSRPTTRRTSFVERVLDGTARIDQLEAEIAAWQSEPGARPLHELLGLSGDELLLIAGSPDALRYVLHARRFGLPVPLTLATQRRVRDHATLLAAETTEPFELAAIDAWQPEVDARARERQAREASHA